MLLQVEVDLLTGTTTILRSDLTYDCGQSLNPAVDLGQVHYQSRSNDDSVLSTNSSFLYVMAYALLIRTKMFTIFSMQVEGAFVQGIGFFMYEEYLSNSDGLVVSDGTWTYKVPTVDTIPKQFNVELINSGYHKRRVLSSKGNGIIFQVLLPAPNNIAT